MGGGSAVPRPPLALTMGDPAGIGPEITLKAWLARAANRLPAFVVYGDAAMYAARASAFGLSVSVQTVAAPAEAMTVFPSALPVLSVELARRSEPGKAAAANAAAVIQSIERAVADAARHGVSGVVTNPIAKSVLYAAGFNHPGQTEFLGALAAVHRPGQRDRPVMMLTSDRLRVVPLTIHVPLSSVPKMITRQLINETVRTTWSALRRDFGISNPRISVAGLNPHAGEDGALGTEDRDIIAPAIRELQREGLAISGPHSADTLFHAAAREHYDVAIAMYHDQALIPIKTLSFDDGVNVTLGLPFVRTSPDHGTAFDIAPHGRASAASLIAAIKLAETIAARRAIAIS
jgi:4-hydroxythreonine-4-phosphate dehydrogenase